MKKVMLTVAAIFVAVMFASVAIAATSYSANTSCGSCAKPTCGVCSKSAPCNTCVKKPACSTCNKATPCNTCAKPCVEQKFKRDVLGQKIPVETIMAGDAMTDTATKYEGGLISGKE